MLLPGLSSDHYWLWEEEARQRKNVGVVISPNLLDHISHNGSCYSFYKESLGVDDFTSSIFIRKSQKPQDASDKLVRFPELQGNIDIDELHHGEWWINTWEKRCKRDSNEILHDQLCGQYQTVNTKMICRHCNCPRALSNNSRVNVLKVPVSIKSGNMQMSNFTAPTVEEGVNVKQYFKNVSHHRVHNASPGERLHMHQLGCAKQAAETFREEFLGNNTPLLGDMDRIASYYGTAVQMEFDCDFPQTNFSESIHTAKKEGNQYIGMFCIQMLALLSAEGPQLLLSQQTSTKVDNPRRKGEEEIDGRIYAIELLLGMEEFLKYAGTFDEVFKEDNKGVLNLDKMVVHFINCINNYLQQSKGEAGGWSARSKFFICVMDGLPYMKWDKKKNASVPWFPLDVLTFCCDVVLPAAGTSTLCGSTEHKRYDSYCCMGLLFCAHPSFKSDSGQLSNIWYNSKKFHLDLLDGRELQVYPCQILCLLHLEGPFKFRQWQEGQSKKIPPRIGEAR
eukprot:jgi/Psemu1/2691/gm1.2691_g